VDDFSWMVGEESSDPIVRFEGRRVRVDQMQSTGHFDHLEADLAAIRSLGVRLVRYGMSWRRTEPAAGVYSWDLWDRAFAAFDRLGLEMVVDLLHFGVPDWMEGVTDPRLPDRLLRYTEEFLARYPQPSWFTPVNEPYITAYFSTGIGLWNESTSDEPTFVRTLARLCLADLLASAAIRADRSATFVHSEAFGHDVPADGTEAAEKAARRGNAFRLLSFDLRYGVPPDRSIGEAVGLIDETTLGRVEALQFTDGVIAGHDYYPVSARAERPYPSLARAFFDRYGVPFMVSETSNLGLPPDQGPRWLQALFEDGCALRRSGVPFVGICWYSRGDQHDWHTTLTRPVHEVTEVGLFDIERRARPVAETFRSLVARPVPAVGRRS
jgi:hypothetical protein